jgi:uncharacterized DUF497 family protein
MEIEYDREKDRSNRRKHGISFNEASTSLMDEHAVWIEDPDSQGEKRWVLWGMSSAGRLLAVVITLRGNRVRVISARKATKTEARNYAQRI